MSIAFGKSQSYSQHTSVKMEDGVYVDHGIITVARIEYQSPRNPNWKPDDVVLRLKLQVEGLSFEKDLAVSGNFRKEGTPQGGKIVAGQGSAFKVLRVFDQLGIIGDVSDQGRFVRMEGDRMIDIGNELTQALIGRTLYFLQFAGYLKTNGKVGYRDYDILAAQQENETEEETRQRLYGQWRNDQYALSQFHPELIGQAVAGGDGSTEYESFDFGANATETVEDIFGVDTKAPW